MVLVYRKIFSNLKARGQVVLFLKRTDLHLLAAFIGAMAAGCVPGQLSPATRKVSASEHSRKFRHVLESTGAKIVFCDHSEDDSVLGTETRIVHPIDSFEAEIAESSDLRNEEEAFGSEALIQFSSGSTGLQKGVILSHSAILEHMESYASSIQLRSDDSVVSWLPLYHDMGLIASFLLPLIMGIPVTMIDPFDWLADPSLLPKAAVKFGATLTFLPNFAFQLLSDKCPGSDWRGMRLFVNCSEPARASTHDRFLKAFPGLDAGQLSVCYALAENTFAVSQTEPGRPVEEIEVDGKAYLSCGSIVSGTEIKLLNPDRNGVGEIAIRGQCLYLRFMDSVDRTVDGYYPTGDLGTVVNSQLVITGRKKDMLIINGKNIYPEDVVFVCMQTPGVYPGRVVCFGIPDETDSTELMVVLVEPRNGAAAEGVADSVAESVVAEVGIAPSRIGVVEHMTLVKTSSGKMSRSRNRELFLAGSLKLINS